MTQNKGFASIALIIIAILILGGGYWVWKNQFGSPIPIADTTGWKVYQDDNLGFEIKYPPDWSVKTYPPSHDNYATYFYAKDYSGFRITAAKVSGTRTMEQMLANGDRMVSNQNPPSKKVLDTKKIEVATLPAIQRIEESYAYSFTTIATYFIKDKIAYSLSLHKLNSSGKYTEKERENYEAILSTFRFIK